MLNRPENPLLAVPKLADMTVREYFMAHAPEMPQSWFKPVVAPEPAGLPSVQEAPTHLRPELNKWSLDDQAPPSSEGIAWVEEWHRREKELTAWKTERSKQALVQWPAAWADAVMAAGK